MQRVLSGTGHWMISVRGLLLVNQLKSKIKACEQAVKSSNALF